MFSKVVNPAYLLNLNYCVSLPPSLWFSKAMLLAAPSITRDGANNANKKQVIAMRSPSVEDGLSNWIALLKQWRIGSFVAICGFIVSCLIILYLRPVYKADVQLLLPVSSTYDPASRKNILAQADPFVVRSYADILINDTISKRVIENMHLDGKEEFAEKPSLLAPAIAFFEEKFGLSNKATTASYTKAELREAALLADYESRLKAVNDGRSLIVDLSFQAHDARLAEAVVNAHARAFVDLEIARLRESAAAKADWMRKELDRTAADFLKSQVALQLNSTGANILDDRTGSGISALRMRESLAKTTVDVYGSVLKRYQDMLADESYAGSDIKIVSLATLPTHPVFPKKMLFAAFAALIWVILGIGAAAFAAVLRDKVSIETWLRDAGQPILGHMHFPSWRTRWARQSDRLEKRLFWKEVREIQSAITLTSRRRPIVLITSALPQEGKSLVASAVAHGLAATGVRTLLIDINARNARYAASIAPLTANSCELVDAFEKALPVTQVAAQVDPSLPLFYLGSRRTGQATMPQVTISKLRAVFADIKRRFEVVIIDAPAIEGLADALQLAQVADDVILTTFVDTDPQAIKMCIDKLKLRSAKIRGVVITDKRAAPGICYKRMSLYVDNCPANIWPIIPTRGLFGSLRKLITRSELKEHFHTQTRAG